MEQQVNEATTQLKGLLGIGAGGAAPAPSGAPVDSGEAGKPPAGKKNKNNRNKNKNSRQRGGRENNKEQQANSEADQSRPPKDGAKKGGKGKKNKKANNENSFNKDKIGNKGKDNDSNRVSVSGSSSINFAWSAFQSSPDASSLPVPAFAFSPAVETKDMISISDEAVDQKLASLLPSAGVGAAVNSALANAPRAEDLEEKAIAAAKTSNEENKKDTTPPPSSTGINLAALASSLPDASGASTKATGNNAPKNPGHLNMPTRQQQMPFGGGNPQQQLPPHMNYPYQQQQQHPGQFHPQMNQPPGYQPPPPGFMTIQVQVPAVLMPGRQMVVTSPGGYPVQVAVPEGIPPGMVIPVHVPAGPPLHMMPPQQQQQYQQQQQRYYNNQQPPGR